MLAKRKPRDVKNAILPTRNTKTNCSLWIFKAIWWKCTSEFVQGNYFEVEPTSDSLIAVNIYSPTCAVFLTWRSLYSLYELGAPYEATLHAPFWKLKRLCITPDKKKKKLSFKLAVFFLLFFCVQLLLFWGVPIFARTLTSSSARLCSDQTANRGN